MNLISKRIEGEKKLFGISGASPNVYGCQYVCLNSFYQHSKKLKQCFYRLLVQKKNMFFDKFFQFVFNLISSDFMWKYFSLMFYERLRWRHKLGGIPSSSKLMKSVLIKNINCFLTDFIYISLTFSSRLLSISIKLFDSETSQNLLTKQLKY